MSTGFHLIPGSQAASRCDTPTLEVKRMHCKTILFPACFLLCCACSAGADNDYPARKAAALKKCEAISPTESQSGLLFNPDGYRSYYVQSQCFQEAAAQFRDLSTCDRVRRRWSLFWSSWGVSMPQCRKLVSQGIEADRAELEY